MTPASGSTGSAGSGSPAGALLTPPAWTAGGDPKQFLVSAGLHVTPDRSEPGRWLVRTVERYRQVRPDLVWVDHLTGPGVARTRFELFAAAGRGALTQDGAELPRQDITRLEQKAAQSQQLIDAVVAWQVQTGDAPVEQLPDLVATVHEEIRQIRVEEDPDEQPMVDAGAHLVRWAPQLVHRLKLGAVLLQADYDPRIRNADTAALQKAITAGEPVFTASQGLFTGVLTGDTYLGPLLGALSPIVWGFSAHRSLGAIVYSFGQPIAGTTGNAAELLQTLPCQGRSEARPVPTLPAKAAVSALDWWTARLNQMFGVISDPAVATDEHGVFRAAKQMHALLSIEQLFRRVGSLQTTERDANARRVLLFTVLDTLDRLTGKSIEKLCSAHYARGCLDALRATVPSDGAAILLPGAERAVAALEQLQRGFFLCRQLGATTVPVPQPDGSTRDLDLDRAAAEYLKVLRDATHGHGTNKRARVEITDALLGQHDAEIPHDIVLLGYLYLLDLLEHPEQLVKHLYAGGRV